MLGKRPDVVVRRFLDQMPARFDVADGLVGVHGAVIDVDATSGHAQRIERFREMVDA